MTSGVSAILQNNICVMISTSVVYISAHSASLFLFSNISTFLGPLKYFSLPVRQLPSDFCLFTPICPAITLFPSTELPCPAPHLHFIRSSASVFHAFEYQPFGFDLFLFVFIVTCSGFICILTCCLFVT